MAQGSGPQLCHAVAAVSAKAESPILIKRGRLQELAGLRGVPFCVSLALEVVDFAAPLLQRLIGRAGDALSWLLVRLIGRSLGLVYRGVRESLSRPGGGGRAKRRPPPRPRYAAPSG